MCFGNRMKNKKKKRRRIFVGNRIKHPLNHQAHAQTQLKKFIIDHLNSNYITIKTSLTYSNHILTQSQYDAWMKGNTVTD